MGYLDGSSITVDAIITKKGREKLSDGVGLGISKFALCDDGVNYRLWNTGHASGSNSYGEAIENLPQLEAVPDENQMMKYKLSTGARSQDQIPFIWFDLAQYTVEGKGSSFSQDIEVNFGNSSKRAVKYTFSDISLINTSPKLKDMGNKSSPKRYEAGYNNPGSVTTNKVTIEAKTLYEDRRISVTAEDPNTGVKAHASILLKKNSNKTDNIDPRHSGTRYTK